MKSFCLYLALLCGLATSVTAANEPERPRLVVNIVIDGFQRSIARLAAVAVRI